MALDILNPSLIKISTFPLYDTNIVEIKAKFEMQYRRFNIYREDYTQVEEFYTIVREEFGLSLDMPFHISYTDPIHQDLLPINNDDNLAKSLSTANPHIKLFLYRREDLMWEDIAKRKKGNKVPNVSIGMPQDFRQVSTILYQEGQPPQVLRVKLIKHSPDQKLGFYVRDGKSVRMTTNGIERIDSFFISRLVLGGLAEGTGLLSVEDEILEVNGIEVAGKTLDQVTDIMVANSKNLILTIQPASAPKMAPSNKTLHKSPSWSSSPIPPDATDLSSRNITGSSPFSAYEPRSQINIPGQSSSIQTVIGPTVSDHENNNLRIKLGNKDHIDDIEHSSPERTRL